MNFRKHLTPRQNKIMDEIRELVKEFSREKNDSFTYTLTGLLLELTKEDYVSPSYLSEKLNLILILAEEPDD